MAELKLQEKVASASSGALVSSLLCTPLDVVKVRTQIGTADAGRPLSIALSTARHVVQQEGVSALWRGLQPTLALNLPAAAMYLISFDAIREGMASSSSQELRDGAPLIAAASSRALTTIVLSPLELIRTRSFAGVRHSPIESAKALVRAEGVMALWSGLGPTLWRDLPFSCAYWLAYEKLKESFSAAHPEQELSTVASFAAGLIAGTAGTLVSMPCDVIKTRRQLEGVTAGAPRGAGAGAGVLCIGGGSMSGQSTMQMLARIVRLEGPHALLAGLVPRLAKMAPSSAIMIASYEAGKRHFQRRRE